MVCLETTFLIDLLRGADDARALVDDLESDGVRPTVAPVVAAELWVGANLGSPSELEATEGLLDSLTWLDFTRAAARRAGEIRGTLLDAGEPIGITDAMIAAIAIENDEVLVTRDLDYEQIPDLRTRTY